jgi:hypothetical protein
MKMNMNDESELDRLTSLLCEIEKKAELTAEEKEALIKAAMGLSVVTIGVRSCFLQLAHGPWFRFCNNYLLYSTELLGRMRVFPTVSR